MLLFFFLVEATHKRKFETDGISKGYDTLNKNIPYFSNSKMYFNRGEPITTEEFDARNDSYKRYLLSERISEIHIDAFTSSFEKFDRADFGFCRKDAIKTEESSNLEDSYANKKNKELSSAKKRVFLGRIVEIGKDSLIYSKNGKKKLDHDTSYHLIERFNTFIASEKKIRISHQYLIKNILKEKKIDGLYNNIGSDYKWGEWNVENQPIFRKEYKSIEFCISENYKGFIFFRKIAGDKKDDIKYDYLIIKDNGIDNLRSFGWSGSKIFIMDSSNIGKNVTINGHTYIGENVKIGNHTYVGMNCVIEDNVEISKFTCIRNSNRFCRGCRIGLLDNNKEPLKNERNPQMFKIPSIVSRSYDDIFEDSDDLNKIKRIISTKKINERTSCSFFDETYEKGVNVYIGNDNFFGNSCEIRSGSFIGFGNYIGDNFKSTEEITMLKNNIIGKDVSLKSCVLGFFNLIYDNYVSKTELEALFFELMLDNEDLRFVFVIKDANNFILSYNNFSQLNREDFKTERIFIKPFIFDGNYDKECNSFLKTSYEFFSKIIFSNEGPYLSYD